METLFDFINNSMYLDREDKSAIKILLSKIPKEEIDAFDNGDSHGILLGKKLVVYLEKLKGSYAYLSVGFTRYHVRPNVVFTLKRIILTNEAFAEADFLRKETVEKIVQCKNVGKISLETIYYISIANGYDPKWDLTDIPKILC